MKHYPEWFSEALKIRFDQLSYTVEQQCLNNQMSVTTDEIKLNFDKSCHQMLSKFEDILIHKHSIEKEILYFEGVKDGIQLMRSLINSDDSFFTLSIDK